MLFQRWLRVVGVVGLAGATQVDANELRLDAVIRDTLVHNFEVRIETLTTESSQDALLAERAEFLPFVFADARRNALEEYQNSIDFASRSGIRRWEQDDWTFKSGVGGRLPTGTSYEFFATLYSTKNSLNAQAPSVDALFRPEVETFAGVKLTQSLLRNFGWGVNTAGLQVARIQVAVDDLQREVLVNNKVLEVTNAYYDLLFAANDRTVKAEALEIAQRFLALARERRDVGKAAEVDVAQAEVNVSEAQERWILAENAFRKSHLDLVRVMGGDAAAAERSAALSLPQVDQPAVPEIDVAALTTAALEQRADLRAAAWVERQSRLRSDYTRNQRLPELNLEMTYGFNGFGGTPGGSFDVLSQMEEPEWMVGLSFRMPLLAAKEKAQARIAARRAEQAQLTTQMREAAIGLEVRTATDRIGVFQQRLETATRSVELARRVVEVERERYASGRTSSFAILEMQDRLAAARTRELAARVDLIKAVEELQAVTGGLLAYHGVSLVRAETPPPGWFERRGTAADEPVAATHRP